MDEVEALWESFETQRTEYCTGQLDGHRGGEPLSRGNLYSPNFKGKGFPLLYFMKYDETKLFELVTPPPAFHQGNNMSPLQQHASESNTSHGEGTAHGSTHEMTLCNATLAGDTVSQAIVPHDASPLMTGYKRARFEHS